jgi:hypothetical protein
MVRLERALKAHADCLLATADWIDAAEKVLPGKSIPFKGFDILRPKN